MSKRTAIYVRVSTVGQALENQLPDLKRWALANEVEIPPDEVWLQTVLPWEGKSAVWYPDKFTGQTTKRPGWRRLLTAFEAGRLDRVVCWRIDRLGRRATGLNQFFEQCVERGVNMISLRDGIDLSTPAGRMIAGVLASLAQFELETLKERVIAKIELDRQRQLEAHELAKQGLTPEEIALRLCLRPSKKHSAEQIVQMMLAKPAGVMWYGGRRCGEGRKESCSGDRVRELLERGLKIEEVAAATGVHKRTVYRRLKEIQTKG